MKKVIAIGEVLWDVFPTGKVWGGAPANAICYAQQLGLDASMFSAIGKDQLGAELLEAIKNVDFNLIASKVDYPTGSVNITLDEDGNASYEIVVNSAWDFVPFDEDLKQASSQADLILFGTLAQRNQVTRETIQQSVANKKSTAKVLCDLNLRQKFYNREIIENSLQISDFLKINEEELVVLEKMFDKPLQALIDHFNLELVILTLGADGSEIHQGEQCFKHAAIPGNVIDTVGAGDSFTSCFISHYLNDGDIASAQAIASKLAAHVCAHKGAIVKLPDEFK
ncbi:carbohydrate kinase [Lentisphaera marina]|uniref:carbohydrate kinase family protein n=1 Tax=Lentisphaera marina TaxID=1111041 RepID=UPI0023662580|nr:carbohydrate kinase [Lentisphaera marina]MDD7986596.1 carbohydrate kinase [Lentisphaera marina]